MDKAFSFIQLPGLPPKPRTVGLFIGRDRGFPFADQADILESHSDIIDIAKFADHAGLASRYSSAYFKRKTDLYKRHNVKIIIGGVSFEIAYLQGTVDKFFYTARELGFSGVEVSEDAIPEMPHEKRLGIIRQAKALGLEVYTEIVRKYPDSLMVASEAIASITADIEAGSSTVTIEAGETVVLKDSNPQVIVDIAGAVGLDKIVFECEPPSPWTKMASWLVRTFGQGVNLENIPIQDCVMVYATRLGMSRDMGHAFLTEKHGRAQG